MTTEIQNPSIDLDAELAKFEAEERARLGLPPRKGQAPVFPTKAQGQWHDPVPRTFTADQRESTYAGWQKAVERTLNWVDVG